MFYLYKGNRIQFARSNEEVFFCSQCRKECPAESADAFPVAEKILAANRAAYERLGIDFSGRCNFITT